MVYPPDMVDLPASPDFNRALQWNSLKHANFRLNNLKKIDSSLVSEGEREGGRE